jgi:hypothetical protein
MAIVFNHACSYIIRLFILSPRNLRKMLVLADQRGLEGIPPGKLARSLQLTNVGNICLVLSLAIFHTIFGDIVYTKVKGLFRLIAYYGLFGGGGACEVI